MPLSMSNNKKKPLYYIQRMQMQGQGVVGTSRHPAFCFMRDNVHMEENARISPLHHIF